MSERRACRLVNQLRGTQRYQLIQREDEDALTRAIVEFASKYGRYGYRRITALVKRDGWQVGKDRVERIWRREGLKVPQKQKPRGRLWLNDGSCVRLRPQHPNHVWSYDFVSAKTRDGRTVRMLNLIDEHSRECLMIRSERRWSSARVIEALADVMVLKGVPEHLRSDNGPEFVAKDLRKWLAGTGAKTAYIEPGSPWENGYCESFNSKLRDEFLNGEIFYSMKEIRVLAERWRVHYNTIRPHSSLGYRPPAPEVWYVTSALGYLQVDLASEFYEIGSPIFPKVTVKLPGKSRGTFTIRANHVSDVNKYIQSAKLNGKPLNVPRFRQMDMVSGGSLAFEMGPVPNRNWGTKSSSEPPETR
jgi:putative transposase